MTPRQRDCLTFVRLYIAGHDGVSPSYAEIGAELGLNFKSGVHRLVQGLIERGLLRHEGGKARSLVPVSAESEFERGRSYEREQMARAPGEVSMSMLVRR